MKTLKSPLKPLAALLLAALVLPGCDRANHAAAEAKQYVERAEGYRHQGQYQAAIIEARNALKENPNDQSARLKLAQIYLELGQGRAVTQLLEPVQAQPNRDEAVALVRGFTQQRKYQTALELLNANAQRLQLDRDAEANLLRARAQRELGQLDETAATLQRLQADDIAVQLELAQLEWQRGERDEAKARLRKLLDAHADNVDVLLANARIAEQEGDLSRSEDLLSKALIILPQTDLLVPQKGEVLQRLVTTLTKLGRSNEALVYAKTLSDANPQGSILQDKFKQGVELFQAGKLEEAEALLAEVYNESHNESVGSLIGMIRYSRNDLKGAAEYLNSNVDPEVASDSAMTALAATQLRLAQPEKLLEIFDARARANLKDPGLKALVGIALLQTGHTAEGNKLVDEARTAQLENSLIQGTIARHYLLSGQSNRAIETLQTAIKAKPDASLSRLLIAAYASAGKPDQALAVAQQQAKDTPQAESWWVLGRTALQLQKLDQAESALQAALKQDPVFQPAQLDLAQVHLRRKQAEPAAALYKAVLQKQPDAVPALKGMVVVYALQGSDPAAIEKQLLALSNSDNARAVLAEYYLRRQQFEDADRLLKPIANGNGSTYPDQLKQLAAQTSAARALQARDFTGARNRVVDGLKVNPRNPDLLILLARVEQADKRPEEAKKIAAQLALQAPSHPGLLELQGDLAMVDKQPQAAAEHYRKAWKTAPNNGLATKLYQSINADGAAAKTFLSEWKQRLPDSDLPWLFEGIEAQRQNDRTAALIAYETTLKRNPDNVEALNNAAWLYGEQKDGRGLATAEKAARLAPENAAVLDTYGWLLVQNRQRAKGIEVLERAAKLAPGTPEIQEHLRQASSNL